MKTTLPIITLSLTSLAFSFSNTCADDPPDLDALVQLIAQLDDPAVQFDLLKGMREGLKGRKSVKMPNAWKALYPKLAKSKSRDVRREATRLAVIFGDARALTFLHNTLKDPSASPRARRSSLKSLLQIQYPTLPETLFKLLDDKDLKTDALRALAAYKHKDTPKQILSRYKSFSSPQKLEAINTLASRPSYALQLLNAIIAKQIPPSNVPAFTARQLQNYKDKKITAALEKIWGKIQQSSKQTQKLTAKYKKLLTPKYLRNANLSKGRALFNTTCASCHTLFGQGGKIAPDITGSNRANLDYILENILDPNALIGRGYQLTSIILKNNRALAGVIPEENNVSITVQTLTERVVVPKADIKSKTVLPVSMMPPGLIAALSNDQVRDLIAYLASDKQVPLPKSKSK